MNILLADDEIDLTKALKEILKANGYSVDVANNGDEVLSFLNITNYDLIILDIMMPILDGYQTVKKIREKNIDTPVLFLSAKSEVEDKIKGLDLGGDDYLTKPFRSAELLAHIRALTRRKYGKEQNEASYLDLSLNLNGNILKCNGKTVELINKEYQILELFILNPSKVYSADEIIDKVWGVDAFADVSSLWVYISNLRKKLDDIGSSLTIKSIRGIGYSLKEKK